MTRAFQLSRRALLAVLVGGVVVAGVSASSGLALTQDSLADDDSVCADLRRQVSELEHGRDALSDSDFLRLEQDYRMMTRLVLEGREEPANRQALLELAARWGVRCGPSERHCDFEGLEALYRQQSDARDLRRRAITGLRLRLRERDCR